MSSAWSAVKMRSGDTRGVGGPQEEQVNSAAPAAAPAAASAIVDDDNEGDDFSATISSQEPASVSVSKSSAHSTTTTKPSMTRRMLVPFARSSTLKSGSLQDLKSTLSSAMTSTKHQRQQQQQASSEVAAEQQPPLAGNQQSQQIAGPAPGPVAPTKDKVERQRSSQSRPARNPFRSSKSMLLLAQNQHIPQASTQLDCFISKQQADFLNYASQYNTSAAAAAAAAASGNANQSGSDNFWIQDNRLTGPVSGSHFASHEHHQELEGSDHSLSANASHRSNSQAIPMKTKGQMQDNSHHNHHHQQHLQQQQQHQVTSPRRLPHQGSSLAVTTVGGSSSSGCNALSSEQCNEQEHEDRPNCVHIMKKLFFSFLLGTIIAICWVMIIHTLKWIAIRGNEFELLQAQQQSSNNNINIITSSNIIANNANVDINLNELNQDQSSNNNNHNSDATNIHMAHHNQLSPAQHQALQVQAQPSLDQDLANGLQAPVPLRSNGPAAKAVAGSTSSIHKRSLHDTDQSNQVYQEAQFDKRKGRRRKAVSTRLGSIASIYNGSSSYKDVSDGYGDGTARRIRDNNEKIVSNSGARLAANVADDEAETKVPTMAPSNASAKIATKVSSVRDEINNRLRDTRRVSGDAAAGSRFRLERRQVSVSDTAGDQPPDDQDSPPPTPLMLTGQSMPTDENEELDSEGRRLVVASSIQQQPQGQGRRYRQHQQQLQQQQQQNNRTARPGSRRENSSDNGYLTGSTSQGGNSTNATATGGSSGGGKRLRRPQWPMATANQVGPASDLDLVSMPAELNSTADTRLSDRSRNEDDDSNEDDSNNNDGDYTATGGGVGGDAAASASSMGHKTNTNNNPIDEPLLIDGPGGPVVGSDAMLAVGSVQPSSSLERSSQPTISGLVYRAPFFTSWFVSTWNILFMPVFTLISSCCFRNEDSTTKKLLVESISQFMDNGLTTLQFLGRCAFFSVLWIGTIFGIVYSLAHLDATVVMALFACSAALVYLLSWVLLHQQFVGVRIVAVIICTTGIALLAYMDNSRTLGSVLIVAGSALCSAVYKVIYQRMFGFWSIAQMSLFFTLIGLFNAFLMWPIALMLYFLGVELIVWRYIPWMHLTAAGALHLTANIVAYFGPICTYDIFLTLGLLFAVVLSAVIDVTFYKITFFGMKLAGVLLLMIGFLVCLLPENWNEYLYDLVNERFIRWKKQRNLKKSRNKVQDMSTGQMSRLRTPSGRVK